MKNIWNKNQKESQTKPFWTFEIIDKKGPLIQENIVELEDRPGLQIVEQKQIDGTWIPICCIWEEFKPMFDSPRFVEGHEHIRLLEVEDCTGILRNYDSEGERSESWVMHELRLKDVDFIGRAIKPTFSFHHAEYIPEN